MVLVTSAALLATHRQSSGGQCPMLYRISSDCGMCSWKVNVHLWRFLVLCSLQALSPHLALWLEFPAWMCPPNMLGGWWCQEPELTVDLVWLMVGLGAFSNGIGVGIPGSERHKLMNNFTV